MENTEKKLLTLLSAVCVISLPFVLKSSRKTKKAIEELKRSKEITEISELEIKGLARQLEQPSPTNKNNQLLYNEHKKKLEVLSDPNLTKNLLVFFAKGVLSTFVDAFVVASRKVEYPVRPFPTVFKTNIIYDLLFFPILSVIWVKMTYNDDFGKICFKSLIISVPMSSAQWFLERKTNLIKWNKWTPIHTFGSICFTLFTIRGFVYLIGNTDSQQLNEG